MSGLVSGSGLDQRGLCGTGNRRHLVMHHGVCVVHRGSYQEWQACHGACEEDTVESHSTRDTFSLSVTDPRVCSASSTRSATRFS